MFLQETWLARPCAECLEYDFGLICVGLVRWWFGSKSRHTTLAGHHEGLTSERCPDRFPQGRQH
jgi:hypothetical protein